MKKLNKLALVIILITASFILVTCEMEVALGPKLNLTGPLLKILTPESRFPADGIFYMSGTITDETDIYMLNIRASHENKDFAVEWRYTTNAGWMCSLDYGKTWQEVKPEIMKDGAEVIPEWTGDSKNVSWKVPINMYLAGYDIKDGQYQFIVTAFNRNMSSDEDSIDSRIIVLYVKPPLVKIISPVPYTRSTILDDSPSMLYELSNKSGNEYRKPEYLGKYINGNFKLQWNITEKNDIQSIDIRFYDILDNEGNVIFAENIPDNDQSHIFRAYIDSDVRPNGFLEIPDLGVKVENGEYNNVDAGYKVNYEILNPLEINGKPKPLQMIVRCYNAAGIPLENKVSGAFVYWHESDVPWIDLPDDLNDFWPVMPGDPPLYSVFTARNVGAKAYDDDGIERIKYTIKRVDNFGNAIDDEAFDSAYPKIFEAPDKNRNLSWEFEPPKEFVGQSFRITAEVFDINGVVSEVSGYFKTTDISLPEMHAPTEPVAINPLYQYLKGTDENNWNFDIKGFATDANEISSIYMVWINPKSANYSAMSQLAYYRDSQYEGWVNAENYYKNNPGVQAPYLDGSYEPDDDNKKNKVWKLDFIKSELDPVTRRYKFDYFINLKLKDDLMIAPSLAELDEYEYLKSQVFLFKAAGADAGTETKTSIIVWSPEGANIAPEVEIDNVKIFRFSPSTGNYFQEELVFDNYDEIDYINVNDRIEISGTWKEDAAKYLNYEEIIRPYFDITIGTTGVIPKQNNKNTAFTITESSPKSGNGRWTVTAVIGDADSTDSHDIRIGNVRDTLMINAKLTNIGGHSSDNTATWFIKSDYVRFLKLGTEPEIRDGEYRAGGVIEFFFEFNKPVKLKPGVSNPVITLNSGGTAVYFDKTGNADTKQYFRYTVESSDSTLNQPGKLLNILDISVSQDYTSAAYPFSWLNADDTEEIRMVINQNLGIPESVRINVIPTGTSNAAFRSVKEIIIDNDAPVLQGEIKISGRGGWYGEGNTIYLTADFDEPVNIGSGGDLPRLNLNIRNPNGNITQRQTGTNVIRNNSSLIFSYKIAEDDYTLNGGNVVIESISGTITDVAGNAYITSSYTNKTPMDSSTPPAAAKVWAIVQDTPTVEVHRGSPGASTLAGSSGGYSETWNPNAYADSNAFVNSGVNIVPLGNYYSEELWVRIIQAPPKHGIALPSEAGFNNLEWTVNYGRDWRPITAGNHQQTVIRNYDISARHADGAGNISLWSRPISLFWDRGDLLTRISTTVPGGTYTYNSSNPQVIPITLNFRRDVRITAPWILRLNVGQRESAVAYKDITIPVTGGTVPSVTINYQVGEYDTTNGNNLIISDLILPSNAARDASGNDVTSMIDLDLVTASGTNIDNNGQKEIKIQTGRPNRIVNPVFTAGTIDLTNDYVPGTITFDFDTKIVKGMDKNITITQDAAGYRLPAVLTEAQYNRFRNVTHVSKYYKKGTNGYRDGIGPDTSTKYILDFNIDTYSNKYAGNASLDSEIAAMAAALRTAEAVILPINSSFITISEVSANPVRYRVTVNLTSSNSLKVQGANYLITYPEGFVQDELGNECIAETGFEIPKNRVGTVARPFIRVSKPQEPIGIQTGSASLPRVYVTERAGYAELRMDCRTPGSQVRYTERSGTDTVNLTNTMTNNHVKWYNLTGTTDWSKAVEAPVYSVANDLAQPNDPQTAAVAANNIATVTASALYGTTILSPAAITPARQVGTGPVTSNGVTSYDGYSLRIRATGYDGTNFSAQINQAHDMLYRTVLSFKGVNVTANQGQTFGSGDQLWVRGGDTLNGTTITGFPLTPEDNFNALGTDERAGIRLMSRINNDTTTLVNSTWQWVTWDINAIAYITLYLGRDTLSSADDLYKYGPLQFASQNGNWGVLKLYYGLVPGSHTWLNSVNPNCTTGNMNEIAFTFNASFDTRPQY